MSLTTVMIYIFSFILGACIGSAFLCYLDRRQRKESWMTAHSCCTVCGHELRARDLIPILSYILLRGKCRYCGKHYPIATILSEFSCGCAFLFAVLNANAQFKGGNVVTGIAQAVIFVLLGLAAVNDICCHECEYFLQYAILAIGIIYTIWFGLLIQLATALLFAALLLLLNCIYLKIRHIPDAIGLADIVVCTGTACVIPPLAVPFLMMFTCIISIAAIPLARKNQKQQGTEEQQFGVGLLPFVLFGMFLAILVNELYLGAFF